MRITIETDDERGRGESPIPTSMEPGRVDSVDAGAPPESLTQLPAAVSPPRGVAGSSEGRDAGPPPAWLLEAVHSTTPLPLEAGGTDAGTAPDMST
jgi:hypothetical protein